MIPHVNYAAVPDGATGERLGELAERVRSFDEHGGRDCRCAVSAPDEFGNRDKLEHSRCPTCAATPANLSGCGGQAVIGSVPSSQLAPGGVMHSPGAS